MSKGPWFRAKRFGWGWTPITWEGWLVTLLGVVAFLAIDLGVMHLAGAFRR